jgi:hypothetical protein
MHALANVLFDIEDLSWKAKDEGRFDDYRHLKKIMTGVGRAALGFDAEETYPDPWRDRSAMPQEVRDLIDRRIEYLEKEAGAMDRLPRRADEDREKRAAERAAKAQKELDFLNGLD